jgi:Right handed beta helix region
MRPRLREPGSGLHAFYRGEPLIQTDCRPRPQDPSCRLLSANAPERFALQLPSTIMATARGKNASVLRHTRLWRTNRWFDKRYHISTECDQRGGERGRWHRSASREISMVTQLRLKSRVVLQGVGWESQFKQIASTSGHLVILDTSSVEFTGIRDLLAHGNKTNQSVANDGIHFDNEGGTFSIGDPVHRISNVLVTDLKGNGIVTTSQARECRFSDVYVNGADASGYVLQGTDSVVARCVTGSSGKAGFQCKAPNTRYVGCKAFGSGRVTAGSGDGFFIEQPRTMLVACESQDNKRHGFVIFNANHCVLSGCDADSNGTDFGIGFRLDNADHNVVEGCSAYNRPGKSSQKYGYEFANAPAGNRVLGIADANASGDIVGSTSGNVVSIT